MQKECFSLPAIKATMTLFLYSKWGKKYIYISLYINIYTQMWLGCSNSPCCWQGGTTQHWNTIQTHGSLGGRSWKGLQRALGVRRLRLVGWDGGSQMGLTTSMHAPIIYWRPSKKQSFPNIYSLTPFNPLTLPLFNTSTIPNSSLCICYMICIYFYNNLPKVKGDILLDIIE